MYCPNDLVYPFSVIFLSVINFSETEQLARPVQDSHHKPHGT